MSSKKKRLVDYVYVACGINFLYGVAIKLLLIANSQENTGFTDTLVSIATECLQTGKSGTAT